MATQSAKALEAQKRIYESLTSVVVQRERFRGANGEADVALAQAR